MALLAVRWERVEAGRRRRRARAASAPRLPLLPSARGSLRSERRPLPPPPRLTTHDCKDCSAGTRRGAAVLSAPRSAHLPSSLRLRAQFRCLPARRKKEPQRLSLRNKRPISPLKAPRRYDTNCFAGTMRQCSFNNRLHWSIRCTCRLLLFSPVHGSVEEVRRPDANSSNQWCGISSNQWKWVISTCLNIKWISILSSIVRKWKKWPFIKINPLVNAAMYSSLFRFRFRLIFRVGRAHQLILARLTLWYARSLARSLKRHSC